MTLSARLRARQQHELASRRVTPGHARRRRVPPPRRQTTDPIPPRPVGYHSEFRVSSPSCPSALSPRTMSPPRSVRAIQWSPPHASMDMVPALEHFGVVRVWRKPLGQAACAQPPFSAAAREKGRLQNTGFRDDCYVECKNSRTNHFWPKNLSKKDIIPSNGFQNL